MQSEARERRAFLKEHVPEVASLRGSLLETMRANRDAAARLAAGEGGMSTAAREELSSRLAVLLVDRSQAEERLRSRKRRVEAVAGRLRPAALAGKLHDAAEAAREESEAFGNRLRRGEGRPAGEEDGQPQRAWLGALVEGYITRRTRYHELAAKAALVAAQGSGQSALPGVVL